MRTRVCSVIFQLHLSLKLDQHVGICSSFLHCTHYIKPLLGPSNYFSYVIYFSEENCALFQVGFVQQNFYTQADLELSIAEKYLQVVTIISTGFLLGYFQIQMNAFCSQK